MGLISRVSSRTYRCETFYNPKTTNMQRYSANFRGLNRIKQQEQVRPKYYSIYNFSETGHDDLGKIAPLPAVSYYKEKIKQESKWMMKTHMANSPKWSWIISNHYERQNTYLRGRAILPRYKNYVVLKRLDVSAQEHGLEGAQELIKFLRIAGTKFEPEILQQLAIYEHSLACASLQCVRRLIASGNKLETQTI